MVTYPILLSPGGKSKLLEMPIDPAELADRLEQAARDRLALRRATLELRQIGDRIYEQRRRGKHRSERPDKSRPGDR